jgi:hypothetical protein
MTGLVNGEAASPLPTDTENLLNSILSRLVSVLRDENSVLESGVGADHAVYIVAKNQALRELMVMQRSTQMSALSAEALEQLGEARKLVDRNHHLLKLQVSALNDLTSFLTQSAISEQGDGTYTRERQ